MPVEAARQAVVIVSVTIVIKLVVISLRLRDTVKGVLVTDVGCLLGVA